MTSCLHCGSSCHREHKTRHTPTSWGCWTFLFQESVAGSLLREGSISHLWDSCGCPSWDYLDLFSKTPKLVGCQSRTFKTVRVSLTKRYHIYSVTRGWDTMNNIVPQTGDWPPFWQPPNTCRLVIWLGWYKYTWTLWYWPFHTYISQRSFSDTCVPCVGICWNKPQIGFLWSSRVTNGLKCYLLFRIPNLESGFAASLE